MLVRVPRLVEPVLRGRRSARTPWWMRSVPISTMKKRSHGRVSRRCSATLEALLRHLLDLGEEAILPLGAEALDVDHVAADETLDLLLDLRRIRVLASLRIRSEEARNHDAVDAADWKGLRDAEDDYRPPTEGEDVPHAGHAHGAGVGEGQRIVGVVAPVAEPIKAERARTA